MSSKNIPMTSAVLVAGGAGFIGSNLVRTLLGTGKTVHCIDNFSTGYDRALAQCVQHNNFRLYKGDITDCHFMAQFRDAGYAEIYNLACPTGVPNIAKLGEEMLLASSAGSLNLLQIAKNNKSRYLFASTAEVYGDPEVFPQSETYAGNVDCVGPRSAYEEGKRFGEALTKEFARRHGVDTRIIRIFNTYGPNMWANDTRVIPHMLSRMALGEAVTIFGDGKNTRTFLHVKDLIRGFFLSMQKPWIGDVYNIGGEVEYTMTDLFALCSEIADYHLRPIFKPHFIEDHRRRLPDTTRIRHLGWRPRITLKTGLQQSYISILSQLQTTSRKMASSVLPVGISAADESHASI